jgi:hypothetical protein
MTALQELLAKVEAGDTINYQDTLPLVRAWRSPLEYFRITDDLESAYNGSLDAAKALHEAVIDDYNFRMGVDWAEVWLPFGSKLHKFNVANTKPARAWLIAIIKALIAQEVTK